MRRKVLSVLFLSLCLMVSGCGKKSGVTVEKRDTKEITEALTDKETEDGTDRKTETVSDAETGSTEPETSSEIPPVIDEETDFHAYVADVEEQLILIRDRFPEWHDEELTENGPLYAVTDLDHNGRLEVILSVVQGSGMYSYSQIYEVSEDRQSLETVVWSKTEGDSEPDITVETTSVYYDAEKDAYYYIFDDILRVSNMESIDTLYSFSLQQGEVTATPIAAMTLSAGEDGESVHTEFRLADGTLITSDEYYNADEALYAGAEPMFVQFYWFMDPTVEDMDSQLALSWEGFSISRE